MTNHERGRRLLDAAEELYEDLQYRLERRSWNLAVRRAQEVVELALKGLLSLMGVDYPKTHDVSEIFARTVQTRDLGVPDAVLEDLRKLSPDLARKRAPAFYFEEEHDEDEARQAFEQATQVLTFGRELARRLM